MYFYVLVFYLVKTLFIMNCKYCFFLFVFILCSGLQAKEYEIKDYLNPNNSDRKAYIEKYKKIAIQEMGRAKIPASIKLAQGILESGDGKSSLAREANNHFGMKCGSSWTGDTYYLKDDDYKNGVLVKSCFRVFKNPEESYYAHSEFLRDPRKAYRYGFLFDLDIMDYRAWAKGLKKSGYATNPNYAKLLIGIIEANELYKYDKKSNLDPEFEGEAETPIVIDPDLAAPPPTSNEIVIHNGLRMVIAQEGDTPRSIEDRFNVSAKRVANYNELYSAKTLEFPANTKVYLQPKRKKWRGKTSYHKVKAGETMYSISQIYGIKVAKLYAKNRMEIGTEPAYGEKISIRRKIKRKKKIRIRSKDAPTPPSGSQPIAIPEGDDFIDVVRQKMKPKVLEDRVEAYIKIIGEKVDTNSNNTETKPDTNSSTPPKSEPTKPDTKKKYHTVVKGDTLYGIASKYNVSVDQIKELNKLTSNIISIGDKLRIE